MNPVPGELPEPPSQLRCDRLRRCATWLVKAAAHVLLADVAFWRRRPQFRVEVGGAWGRFARGFLYRLVLLPIALVSLVVSMVVTGTHPPRVAIAADPNTYDVYFDPVSLASDDGTPLEGWLIPQLNAQRVIDQGEAALRNRHAAVVLVHDFGSSRAQMLPLVKPLHDGGFIVLAINLRGCGGSGSGAATFGIREAQDVQAAVEMLRRRPFVDPGKIAIVGVGTGATAAILAAWRDPQVAAVVADHPLRSVDQAIEDYLCPRSRWLAWSQPLHRWTFEIAYRVDTTQIQRAVADGLGGPRPLLVFDESSAVRTCFSRQGTTQLLDFLNAHLSPAPPATAGIDPRPLEPR